jgi:argininosuccinate synthase
MLLHEGQFYDPVMRNIEAFFDSTQERVTGEVTLYLGRGVVFHQTTESPYTLIRKGIATYGEDASGWTGAEARAFSKLTGITSKLANSIQS